MADERLKHQVELEDSILTQAQSLTTQGFGFRAGLEKDYRWLNLPIQLGLYAGLYARKIEYTSATFYTKYTNEPLYGTAVFGPYYTVSSSGDEYTNEEKWTFSPQIGSSIGIMLTANERWSIVPSVNFNLTLLHNYQYDLDDFTERYQLDGAVVPMLQVNYHLLENRKLD